VALMGEARSFAATGALIGLGLGLLHYVLILAVMGKMTASVPSEEGSATGAALVARRLRSIKLALLVASFLLFPLVGYVAGVLLTPGGIR
jgi:hypothetical protein